MNERTFKDGLIQDESLLKEAKARVERKKKHAEPIVEDPKPEETKEEKQP